MCMKILMAEALDWSGVFHVGSHVYARHFRDSDWTVGWVSHPWHPLGLIKDRLLQRDLCRRKASLWAKGGEWKEGVFSYAPMTLFPYRKGFPFNSAAGAGLSLKLGVPSLGRVLRRAGFDRVDVLWVTDPSFVGLAARDLLEHRLLVYRMADDVLGFANMPWSIRVLEEDLLRRADFVFATARSLVARAGAFNDSVYYLPNAGRPRMVRPAGRDLGPLDLELCPPPRIVYVGAMSEWFDRDLLLHCARVLSWCSFVLIGPKPAWAADLTRQAPNIHFLGARAHEEIPEYLAGCTVGIIPFVRNRLTRSIHPLKLYEYLAAGLAVVSTDLDEVRASGAPVLLADSASDFAARIAETLEVRAGFRRGDVERFLADNSWDARFAEIESVILRQLATARQ